MGFHDVNRIDHLVLARQNMAIEIFEHGVDKNGEFMSQTVNVYRRVWHVTWPEISSSSKSRCKYAFIISPYR
jgi:hypothetical protein